MSPKIDNDLSSLFLSNDVASVLADVAIAQPLHGTVELAGPEPFRDR